MELKSTLVIGASENIGRYSNRAVKLLKQHNHRVFAYGLRRGIIEDVAIETDFPEEDVHTVTMYVGAKNQPQIYDSILKLNPRRVIFNPGTENKEFATNLKNSGIEVVEACTLVMLNSGIF